MAKEATEAKAKREKESITAKGFGISFSSDERLLGCKENAREVLLYL